MAASLDNVLASIPGYGGYLAKRRYNEDQQMQQLQQMGAIGTVFGQLQSQADQAKIKEILDKGATPEETFNALVRAGPSGAAAAHQYATGLTQLQTMKNLQSLQGSDLNTLLDNPQKAMAAVIANPHLGPELERLRGVREGGRALEDLRGPATLMPAGTAVPGTNMTTEVAIPPEERGAFNRVASGQVVRSTPQLGDISAARTNPELARLMQSPIPQIADSARALNSELQGAGNLPDTAKRFEDRIGRLATNETNILSRQVAARTASSTRQEAEQNRPHPVIGVDEKGNQVVTWVTPSQGAQTLPTRPVSTTTSANQQALKLKAEFLSMPAVKEASNWDSRIVPVATFMANRANADNAAIAVGDNALIKAYVTAVRPSGARTDMSTAELSKLPGLESRIQAAIANVALGRHLPDAIAAEMWSNVSSKYKALNDLRNTAREDIKKRATTMRIDPATIFSE